jgi:hypothetical protein
MRVVRSRGTQSELIVPAVVGGRELATVAVRPRYREISEIPLLCMDVIGSMSAIFTFKTWNSIPIESPSVKN